MKNQEAALAIAWQLSPPMGAECCRWLCGDGRWIAVTLGSDAELGSVFVTSSDGRQDALPSYEDALALARAWRT